MTNRPNRRKRWPRIALAAVDQSDDQGKRWLKLEHHTTRRSIYTLYRQPARQAQKIDRHGRFTEDAQTRQLSAEFGRYVVKDHKGNFCVVQHWAWPPMQITFGSSHLGVISQGE